MNASSPYPLQRRAACTLVSLAAGCSLSGTAFAWPFVQRAGGLHDVSDLSQHLMIQTDTDRPCEIFGGGDGYLQMSAAPTGGLLRQVVDLPAPDKDPYAANNSSVGFSFGRGDAGDIDGDGDTDIVYSAILTYNGGQESANVRVVVCFNNGNGTWTRGWQLKATSSTVVESPEVKLADLDRDGDLDLIETQNGVRVHWNPGNGDFSGAPVSLFSSYKQVPELEVADFDGNGWPDIAVFGDVAGLDPDFPLWLTGRLTMLSNDGGTFTAATVMTLPTSRTFEETSVADVNEDGKPDLVVTRSRYDGGRDLHWHRNTGSGFAAPVLLQEFPDLFPAFVTGDLDEDGHPDILLSTHLDGASWMRGNGTGAFYPPAVLQASASTAGPSGIGAGDMDGDGDLDLLISGALLENLAPHKGCDAQVVAFSGINPSGTVDLTVGDVNNDGKEDLILADGGAQRLRWYAGNGTGLDVPAPISTGNLTPLGVAAGDFNGDGWTDLVWTTNGLMSQAISSNGSGFSWIFSSAANMTGITAIEARDMDRDGDTDILSISPSAGLVRIHANNGTASWLPQNVETGLTGLGAMSTGQLTPGGRPEIVILSGALVTGYQHNPATGWGPSGIGSASGSTGSRAVITADITDDAGLEAVFALNSNEIKYSRIGGSPVTTLTTTHPVKQLAAVDWNNDGYTDLLVATTNGVTLYPNSRNAAGQPFNNATGIPLITGVSIQDLVTMKLDADGYRDAVAVDSTGQLHLIYNSSGAVRVSPASPGTRSVLPGDSGITTYLNAKYENISPYTQAAKATPAMLRIQFLRSIVNGNQDTPGSYLSPTEVSELVESVSITRGGSALYTAPANTLFGGMTLNLPADARQSLALLWSNPDLSGVQLTVKLKPSAASASVQHFYVEYFPDDSYWMPLDDAGTSGPLPLRLSGNTTATVRTLFMVGTPSPMDLWRMSNFGTYNAIDNAANEADPDGDGFSNIMEYITGRSPVASGGLGSSTPVVDLTLQGSNSPVLATLRLLDSYDPKVRLTLQQSTTLGQWTTVSTRLGTGAWTGTQPAAFPLNGSRTRFVFSTAGVPSTQPRYFLRLVAEELP